ncbi:hypothetical protein [Persicobacter sp. CCB-QB2]|uniref:hypothetical protein n=1 Tax=Persicobacter sp. CCB-QB2 TaxID=1561025 RepID=UPI0006A945DE|nr:hypothetical protein [Persicobacter sp. CCB-QB2]
MATKAQWCFFDRSGERRANGSPVKVNLFKEDTALLFSSFKFVFDKAMVQLPRCKRTEMVHLMVSLLKWIGVPVLWYYGDYGSWFWNLTFAVLPVGFLALVVQLIARIRPKAYYIFSPLLFWELAAYLIPAYYFTNQILDRWYLSNKDLALTILLGMGISQLGLAIMRQFQWPLEQKVLGGHYPRLLQKMEEGFTIGPNPFIHSFLGLFWKAYKWFI